VDIDPYQTVSAAASWPPASSVLASDPDLPGPAYVVSRVALRQVLPLVTTPPLLYLVLFRLGGSGVPTSRLVNPGILGLLAALEVVMAALCRARCGRPTVVGTTDWIAVRSTFGREWRQQPFATVSRVSRRIVSRPGRGLMTTVTMADREDRRVHLTLGVTDPALAALLGRLGSAGAVQVDRRELSPMSRRHDVGVVVLILGGVALPVIFLALGPLRLLPSSVAGAFTWSGCRASLAVEGKRPESGTPYMTSSLQAAGETWRLVATRQEDASTFAQHTGDPKARLAHLRNAGFLVAYHAYLQGADGAMADVKTLRFRTPEGAQAYEAYVNRAVCEDDWQGHAGPRPTEVYLHRGQAAFVRWIGGDSILEISQIDAPTFCTPRQVQAIDAALPGYQVAAT
jgi:hypothetical protein